MIKTVKVVGKTTLTTEDKSGDVYAAAAGLTGRRVLVGVPSKNAPRKPQTITLIGNKGKKIGTRTVPAAANNALIAYIQDNGSPLQGIPKREFLRPGIRKAKDAIVSGLKRAGKAAMSGNKVEVEQGLHAAGLAAQAGVRSEINNGNFLPLKPATIAARIRRGHKSTKPLVEYGEMRNAINYVVE